MILLNIDPYLIDCRYLCIYGKCNDAKIHESTRYDI